MYVKITKKNWGDPVWSDSLVQILVIVAIIQMKNLKIEAEKGFRRTLFEPELVDPNMEINFVKEPRAVFRRENCNINFDSKFIEREIF